MKATYDNFYGKGKDEQKRDTFTEGYMMKDASADRFIQNVV